MRTPAEGPVDFTEQKILRLQDQVRLLRVEQDSLRTGISKLRRVIIAFKNSDHKAGWQKRASNMYLVLAETKGLVK